MKYNVVFSLKALKDLKNIPAAIVDRIFEETESLSLNPYPRGSLKLKGMKEELWRIRVGDYRILYSVEDKLKIIDIRKVGHRKEIY